MIIKEKCNVYDDEEGKWYMYHYFDINIDKDTITVKVADCGEDFSEEKNSYDAIWHIPVQKVPELIKNITEYFYTFNPYKETDWEKYYTNLGDSFFEFDLNLDERSLEFKNIWLGQSNDHKIFWDKGAEIYIHGFTMEWNDKYATPMELEGKRIMPKSLKAFLEGMKKTYNTWQKKHPDYERIK